MNNILNDILKQYLINHKVIISTISEDNILTFLIVDENTVKKSFKEIKKEIHLVFGPIDESLLNEWFDKKTSKYENDVNYILQTLDFKYKLKLGKRNWVLTNYAGKNIDFKLLRKEFSRTKISSTIFKKLYDNWYNIKVIKKTEELCGF